MMVLKMFAVFDGKASAFMIPFCAVSVAVAKRNITRAVMDETTDFYHFPEDYSLFEVASWDSDEGKVTVPLAPINHGLLTSFVRKDDGK